MTSHQSVDDIEADIIRIERAIFAVQDEIAGWNDAAIELSTSAAIERANNAGMGRGLGGALFGAKYRAGARRAAAGNNASLARQVAVKRAEIARTKQVLKARERDLRTDLRELKLDLKRAHSLAQMEARRERAARAAPPPPPPPPPPPAAPTPASDVKSELQRLKRLHQEGQLDALAYEKARIALMEAHLRG
ncbi:MAG TPA: hypothetical protein VGO55_08000 [Allosphingosinicella sp.]|jgi:hypothetical protein|nr:hypothetical protein [Allosphingosinicella sp.]